MTTVAGDLNDTDYRKLGRAGFDVVCQFITFTPEQMADDIAVFGGGTGQFIFISSASVYQKPPRRYVITEETPTVNPFWIYSQNKIACEAVLKRSSGLPWTIVRPSHTVRSMLPTIFNEGDAVAPRMLAGKPVILAGDGATVWTLTRCADFATPFVKLFGATQALGEDFHITSDHAYTWNDIYAAIANGLGVEADIVHVPTDTLVRYNPEWKAPSWATRPGRCYSTIPRSSGWQATSLARRTWRGCWPSPLRAFKRVFPPREPTSTSLSRFSIGSHANSESWERMPSSCASAKQPSSL